jgi:hypothetical protein
MPAAAPIQKGENMNEQELQAIEERANKATPGQLEMVIANKDVRIWRDGCIVAIFPDAMPYYTTVNNADADAEFYVAARADVPALIAEVRGLRAKLDAVHEYAAYYNDVSNQGDAPETFANWYNGAAQQEAQP